MRQDDTEDKLKYLFSRIRHKVAGDVPSYNKFVHVPEHKTTCYVLKLRYVAAVVVIVVCAVTSVILFKPDHDSQQNPVELQQWTFFSGWRPASDSFLAMPGGQLENEINTFTDKWIDSKSVSIESGMSTSN